MREWGRRLLQLWMAAPKGGDTSSGAYTPGCQRHPLRASCTEHGCAGPDLQLIPCHSIPHDVPFCVMPPMLLCHVWCAMRLSCFMCPCRCVTCQPGAICLPSGGRGYSWCASATSPLWSSWPYRSCMSHTSHLLRAVPSVKGTCCTGQGCLQAWGRWYSLTGAQAAAKAAQLSNTGL